MKKQLKKVLCLAAACLMLVAGAACGNKGSESSGTQGSESGGKVTLTFQIWDIVQREAMENMAAAYMEKNPDVTIEVQVTNWDEYWTKLEAAATGDSLPDIFWMHTNEVLKYADNGMLADLTDLYDDVSETYYQDNFSENSLANAFGSDGKIYGVPKDKDAVCMVYNKEMFDQAGVAYPDESWTWDDLVDASQKIYDETGKYGYMAYADEQIGYWNFVYQAGGYILSEDKTTAGFTDEATKKAMEFYIGLQKNDWCPDQNYFAETAPSTAFFSEAGAIFYEGNWNLKSHMDNYPDMIGKWDVAVLPKCPDPVKGDGRASITNSLTYATGAKGKNLEAAKDFIKFLGTEEAMTIQGSAGSMVPSYNGLEDTWVKAFDQYDYVLDVQKVIDMFDYGVQSVNNAARPDWKPKANDELLKIYSGEITIEEGLSRMQTIIDEASSK